MIISRINGKENEFEIIKKDEHINEEWKEIDNNFNKYFELFYKRYISGIEEELGKKYRIKKDKHITKKILIQKFQEAIDRYIKDSKSYKNLFTHKVLNEFKKYDPNSFKKLLNDKCPIIRTLVNSDSEDLKEWQIKYRNTSSKELLDIFSNVINFADEYSGKKYETELFNSYDKWEDFNFDELDEHEDYKIEGVIGMGIKSTVLYHIYPHIFPLRTRFPIYALFFLTDYKDFGLPSKTSEFLMYDYEEKDKERMIEHNYWYPYPLFTLYSLRIYRKIKDECGSIGVNIDENYRFVYVNLYFDTVCEKSENKDKINSMLCLDLREFAR